MRLLTIISILLIASNAFTQSTFIGVDSILNNYNEDKYLPFVINVLYDEYHDSYIEPPCTKEIIVSRSTKNDGVNILIIPQFLIQYDTINDGIINLHRDSIYPINRSVIFNKSRYFGTLLFIEDQNKYYDSSLFTPDSIFFCPCVRKSTGYTDLRCGKYIYREKNYTRSLKQLIKKKPVLIFKVPNFERVWFYIDKNKKICVFTYDSEYFELDVFFKRKNLLKYSMPVFSVKPFNE
ncbi:hypothetical protein JXI42_07335 [bacterium]|nr:hypothetical protein [bacterium]